MHTPCLFRTRTLPALFLLATSLNALAQHKHHDAPVAPVLTTPAASAATPAREVMSEAEVRRVDLAAGTVTLRHGAIKNLDMPPMTMVFKVPEPSLLSSLKPGDRVRFHAELIQGVYTVLKIEPAP